VAIRLQPWMQWQATPLDIAEKRRADGDSVQRTPHADTARAPAHEDGKGKFRQHNQRPTGE
jgi:hypothetical protein